jgi:hypothetical protein
MLIGEITATDTKPPGVEPIPYNDFKKHDVHGNQPNSLDPGKTIL